ncbi:hypothetical protein AO843_22505 [Lysinibacillus sp. ZYM-1]|nr:hypothetical protein AO843_22505 [Lysinibacillus sp. ZYM-1]
MLRIIKSEFGRMFYKKSTKIIYAITILFPILIFYFFQQRWGNDYYTVDGVQYSLNNLNYPVTQMLEFNALFIFIILPLFFSESLSSEIDSGGYKMILLRPFKKWKLLIGKWIALMLTYMSMLLFVFLINSLIGYLFMPNVEYTSYYNINENLYLFDSIFYNLKFYSIIFIVHLSILPIISLLSILFKKTFLSFFGSIALLVGGIYISVPLQNILFNTPDVAYSIIGGTYELINMLIFIFVTFLIFGVSLWMWNKRIGSIV